MRKTVRMYTYHMKDMMYVNTCRKTIIKLSLYGALFITAVIISITPHLLTYKTHTTPRYRRFPTDLKYILFWDTPIQKETNTFRIYDREPRHSPGQIQFINQKCQFINCYITYNRSLLRHDWDYDAIVFDIEDIKTMQPSNWNLTRSSDQKYVFKSHESPEKTPICHRFYDDFFNLTWTYKLNSDIPHPFINIYNETNKLVGPMYNISWRKNMKRTNKFKNKIKHKKKAVAWIVGKCKLKAKHKDFVDDLKKELKGYNYTLDIFGPCGEKDCPGQQAYKCQKMIEKSYFFQMVLEDSFAEDYVTEKLANVLSHVTIPIVLGGADYNRFMPPGTYINAQSFDLKKLGAIINYLIQNPKMYEYFFDWMNHYYYTIRPRSYICDLCTKLNIFNEHKSYKNFRKWWHPNYKDACTKKHLYHLFNKDYL